MSDPMCPLCRTPKAPFYHQDRRRIYHQCSVCHLVFVAPAYLPTAQNEQAEYQLHENHAHDAGYRQFLIRAAAPFVHGLSTLQRGWTLAVGLPRCSPAY
ncbi:hypothetical protein [Salinimonas marina]|uniref:hypothetical protein n=1 Tax=Salinimonas marina TaxID=2785918 RepID=UPI001E4AB910|nr:hypothetical protein [Salinimonas marina]